MNFKKRTALITGGTKGIGKAIADYLWDLGCVVVITGREKKKKNLKKKFYYLDLDLTEDKSIQQFLTKLKEFPQLDILVNNAGINVIQPIDKIGQENWDKILKVNLTGPMILMKEIAKKMKKQKNGHILNMSSIFGIISKEQRDAYSTSKAGLIGLTRAVALDLAPHNILVNSLCPGFILTDLTKSILSTKEIKELSQQVPLGRFGKVEEIAKIAAFLCSDLNTFLTGQTIIVDGGFTIQ